MPTATDLVTDLPADFAVFGQAVDTSMAGLLGGTTGQILSKTSGTNMAFTWVSPNPGDITAVTAGTGISGGGTSGDVTITNSMATAMTTSGDLIQATGSGTFARLATGTSGQYLTTNGTTNSWGTISAGGMTLISTTTLSSTGVVISSIPSTYKNLVLLVRSFSSTTNGAELFIRLNNDSTANRHFSMATSNVTNDQGSQTPNDTLMRIQAGQSNTIVAGNSYVQLYDYASTAHWKMVNFQSISNNQTTGTAAISWNGVGFYNQTTAISSIGLYPSGGTISGTALLYGVN